MNIELSKILELKLELENHSLLVTDVIQTKEDLQLFMSNHVFAVLDFMSLAKGIQHAIVPSGILWVPTTKNRSEAARLINEIILSEETDIGYNMNGYTSHFDLYLSSMLEIGADINPILSFIEKIKVNPLIATSQQNKIIEPAMNFVKSTFATLDKGSHCIAASFCYGREAVIPNMFKRILNQLNLTNIECPKFHYYLQRHIELDGTEHGDSSKKILEILCENDPKLIHEAEITACEAINARINFFDELEKLILANQKY